MKKLIWTSFVVASFALPAIADTTTYPSSSDDSVTRGASSMGSDASTGTGSGSGSNMETGSSHSSDAQMQQDKANGTDTNMGTDSSSTDSSAKMRSRNDQTED